MTDTTRPDGVEQALVLAVKQLGVMRLYAKLPEHEEVIYQGVLDKIVAAIAALTAPASKPAGVTEDEALRIWYSIPVKGSLAKSLVQFAHAVLALSHAKPALPQGFLADVMTAAGLVAHGKQSKALSERLGQAVMSIRAALAREWGE